MSSNNGPTWYAGAEPGVVGYFTTVGIPDIPATEKADQLVEMPCVVLIAKPIGATDWTPVKVKPSNKDELVRRFPDAWRAFQGEFVDPGGTPLTDIGLTGSKIEELRLAGIMSVETLAELSDERAQALGFGMRKKRDEAREFKAKQHAKPDQQAINDAVATALAAQTQAAPAKPRGRPRKTKAA